MDRPTLVEIELYRFAFRETIGPKIIESAIANVALVDVDREVTAAACVIPFAVKSLDAIHLATAKLLDEAVRLVTYDRTMRSVGDKMGLDTRRDM